MRAVERHVKERLIGATVLVAAAIILVPEMLSGPEPVRVPATNPAAESLRTYSVDLDPAAAPANETNATATQIPAEEPQSFAAPTEASPADALPTEAAETQNVTATESNPSAPAPMPPTEEVQPARATPAEPAPVPTTSAAGRWVVQAGSFSTRAKATEVARDLERRGFATFVRSGTVNGKTMYRVRIGPMAERGAAESLLAKVKLHSPGAAVVPQ